MILDAQSLDPLTSVNVESASVPLQTLVGHMLFPGDSAAQKVYEAYCQHQAFRKLYNSIPDPLKALKPPAKPAMGAKGASVGWDGEPEPERHLRFEKPDETFRRFAQSIAPLEMLTKLPPANISERISHSIISGMLAGFCLMSYCALDTNDFKTKAGSPAKPSKNIVMRMCEDHNLGRKKYGKGRPPKDRVQQYATVTEALAFAIWQRYREVAHLWAAFLLLTGFQFNLNDPTSLNEERIACAASRPELIDIARDFENFMTSFFDGQQHERILREKFAPLHVERHDSIAIQKRRLPELPDDVLNLLQYLTGQYQSE